MRLFVGFLLPLLVACSSELGLSESALLSQPSPSSFCQESPTKSLFSSEEGAPFQKLLTLADCIDLALERHPLTYKSWASTKAAYYGMKRAESAYFPEVTASLSYGHVDSSTHPEASTPLPGEGYQKLWTEELTLSWLLLDFGGRAAKVNVEKEMLQAAGWTHNQTLQEVVYGVVQAYYQAIARDEELEARGLDLSDASTTEASAKMKFEAGIVNRLDLLQAETSRWKAEVAFQEALGGQSIAYATLAEAAGLPPESELKLIKRPKGELSEIELKESIFACIERAKGKREDLLAMAANYRAKAADVRAARSALFPELVSSFELQRLHYQSGPTRRGENSSLLLALRWPLFRGFSDSYTLYQAKASREVAYQSLKDLEQKVVLSVIQSYRTFETAQKNLISASEYLKYAEESYSAALVGYKGGLYTMVDLINSQNSLAEARFKAIDSRSDLLTAAANLSFATGTLFQMRDAL